MGAGTWGSRYGEETDGDGVENGETRWKAQTETSLSLVSLHTFKKKFEKFQADGGLCALDGLDALPLEQRGALHEAMEQQSVSVAKAGLVATLPTRCCVLASAAAPPKHNGGGSGGGRSGGGGWRSSAATLEAPLLSRFDLVFVLRDPRTREFDESVCDAVLGEEDDEEEEDEEEDEEEEDDSSDGGSERRRRQCPRRRPAPSQSRPALPPWPRAWTPELVREYAQWLRTRPAPNLNKEAGRVLLAAYRARRRQAAATSNSSSLGGGGGDFFGGNKSSASVGGSATIRHLESLARVAVAHARLVGREEAGAQDAVVAVALADAALAGGSGSGGDGGSGFDPLPSSPSSQSPSASAFFDGGGIGRGVAGVPACDAVRSRPCADPDAAALDAGRAAGAMVEREEALARRGAALAASNAAASASAGRPGEGAAEWQYGDEEEGEEEGGQGGGGGYF